MPSDALYQALAEALAKPNKNYQALQEGFKIPDAYMSGYKQGHDFREIPVNDAIKKAAVLDNFSKLVDSVGYNKASQIFPMEALGIDSNLFSQKQPSQNNANTSSVPNVEDLYSQLNSGDIGKSQFAQGMSTIKGMSDYEQNRPRTVSEVRQTLISGGIPPAEANDWISKNTNSSGTIPNRNFSDYIAVKGLQNNGARSGFYGARAAGSFMDQLPSNDLNSAGGQAYTVMFSARQGKTLIANPLTSPQKMGLAGLDLARTVLRAAPQLDAIHGTDYSKTLSNRLNQIGQMFTSGSVSPSDIPKLRKEMYDTFVELENSSRPIIENKLKDIEDTYGPAGQLPPAWDSIKKRNLGLNLQDIPFSENGGAKKTYQKTATNKQGIVIGTNDNWKTFEPIQGGM